MAQIISGILNRIWCPKFWPNFTGEPSWISTWNRTWGSCGIKYLLNNEIDSKGITPINNNFSFRRLVVADFDKYQDLFLIFHWLIMTIIVFWKLIIEGSNQRTLKWEK